MNDHERGCEGRNYTCTCGYDDRREAAEARAKLEGAKAMQTKAVEVAAWSHMVPPDGGSPSEDECAVARAAADAIAALDPAQIAGGKP